MAGYGTVIKTHGCPRCKGAVETKADSYGKFRECLNCGFTEDIT
jgi:Zn ribbon nucleic-acid-binding protein